MEQLTVRQTIKKLTLRFAAIFFITLAALTYFSNTINHMLLPSVSVVTARSGTLTEAANQTAKLSYENTKVFSMPCEVYVEEIFVRAGATIQKGEKLAKLNKNNFQKNKNTLYLDVMRLENTKDDLYNSLNAATEDSVVNNLNKQIHELDLQLSTVKNTYDSFIAGTNEEGDLIAPNNGIITDILLKPNQTFMAGEALITYAPPEAKLIFSWEMSKKSGEEFPVGNVINIKYDVKDKFNQKRKAATSTNISKKIYDNVSENYIFTADFKEDKLLEDELSSVFGAAIEFTIKTSAKEYEKLVPISVVHDTSNTGKVIYLVGTDLDGKHFITEMSVTVEASNDFYCAITSDGVFYDKIVLSSSKPIKNNDRVLLEGEQ